MRSDGAERSELTARGLSLTAHCSLLTEILLAIRCSCLLYRLLKGWLESWPARLASSMLPCNTFERFGKLKFGLRGSGQEHRTRQSAPGI
ncbi:hypothetical protein RRG08_064377 [Elysia crispata]|uniref:Uncharacterized protein n=1 Tax=Elysia crispata TaxID=231223 RepID=A0AAE1CY14_9GAST|nr:hypothetical protein RRG08_064377 [Elysia crispata]